MSDTNTKTDGTNKNNELVVSTHDETISENLWIIGVSKTHPGLKYYFNTVTGVSLWNISREDMERATHTMKANGNQPQYINCPEPKDPPPNKRPPSLSAQTYCEHISRQSKNFNKQLVNSGIARETTGFSCDVCYAALNSSPNVITFNFRPYSQPPYMSSLDNACSTVPQSQIQSSSALLDTLNSEKNHYNKSLNYLLGCKRSLNRSIAETVVRDSTNENLHNHSTRDSEFFNHNTSHSETIDLTPLKMFARSSIIQDRWYIVADADIYLHHITFLKSVVNSDDQCCLMIPQNVKIDLDNATKTELRTKAHYASYFIYKMFDYGLAYIDDDISNNIQGKSNEENILDCCTKLKEQNFHVIVISNSLEFRKYRNRIYIPIYTVEELKEYFSKSHHSVTTKSPESAFNVSQSSTNIRLSPNNPIISSNRLPDTHNSIITNPYVPVKRNQYIQTALTFNDNGRQVQGLYDVSKITADAEVQTNLFTRQLEKMDIVHEKRGQPNQNDVVNKTKEVPISNSQTCEPLLRRTIRSPGKRIKLRRRKFCDQTEPHLSTKPVNRSESHANTSSTIVSSSNNNSLLNKKLEERDIEISNSNENLKCNEPTTINNWTQNNEEYYPLPNHTLKSDQGTNLQLKLDNANSDNKNVMFEVTTELMYQNLRRKCDEWVSRFVQIMEEALTQVLRKNSPLHLLPPWNLYEAVTCIKKTFSNDEDVEDASKNFLNVLNRIGNINANINPTQYMEMYSYGVYMIDALQGIFSTCEDLQTAAESLSKLLNDIQDPESDMRNLESFHSIPQEEVYSNNDTESANDKVEVLMIIETETLSSNEMLTENSEYLPNLNEAKSSENDVSNNNTERTKIGRQFSIPVTNTVFSNSCILNESTPANHDHFEAVNDESNDKSQEDTNVICTETRIACNNVSLTSPSKYNLRSKRMRMSSEKEDETFLSKKNIKNKPNHCKNIFLSNFLLEKNIAEENSHNPEESFDKNITPEDISNVVESSRHIKTNEGCSYEFNSQASDLSHKANTNSHEPEIVRNFVICSEFENRLRRTRNVHDEIEEFDVEDDLMATDYINEEESTGDTGRLHIDEFPEFHDTGDVTQHTEQEITKNTEYVKIDFKYFIRKIAQEIKELSSEVYNFSQNSYEALNSLSTSDKKSCIRERAEQTHLCIDKLYTALTKILARDKNGGYNVQALLKHTQFDEISLDEDQMEAYGSFIARCLQQAQDLRSTIEDVLSAVCEL